MLPLYIKKDNSLPINYRPITLTSMVGKLMEAIIHDKLVTFLKENIMISNSQHSFRNKRSYLTNLLDFYNDVFNIRKETKAVYIIYLDFRKAFDKVSHRQLLKKIESCGIAWKNS